MTFPKALGMSSHDSSESGCAFNSSETSFHRLLSNNQIRSIPSGAFEDLVNLKYL